MKKKYPVIGLTGAAGSGKDTAADILQSTHRFIKMGFADPLYEMMSALTQMTIADLKHREAKEVIIERIGVSPRRLGQTLGTEWGRDLIGQDVWIKNLHGRLQDIEERTGLKGLVISDVRFQNEVDYVHDLGGEVWRIERLGNPYDLQSGHRSETAPIGVDDLIVNHGTIEAFQKLVLLKFVDYLGV